MIQIDKGIPIPAQSPREKRRGGGPKPKYPFEKMEVGNSIWMRVSEEAARQTMCYARRSYSGWDFIGKPWINQDGKKGWRIWRIK